MAPAGDGEAGRGGGGACFQRECPTPTTLTNRSPTSMAQLRDIWVPIMEHPWNGPCSGGFITCGGPRIQAPSIFLSYCPLGPRLESGEVHLLWGTWTGTEKRLAPHCGGAMGCPPLSDALLCPCLTGPQKPNCLDHPATAHSVSLSSPKQPSFVVQKSSLGF